MTAGLAQARLALLPQMHLLLPGTGIFASPQPAADVLLLPAAAAVVDVGSAVLVWLGPASDKQQYAQCLNLAQTLVEGRMPAPDVTVVGAETTDEEVLLLPRLLLLADAPPDLQRELLPLLEWLPPAGVHDAAEAARAWMEERGALSLLQWLLRLGVVPMAR